MKISDHALFDDLLDDLSSYLPSEANTRESIADLDYWPDMTLTQFRSLHLAKSFLKKFQDRTNAFADNEALKLFLEANVACKNWSLRIESMLDELLVGLFKQQVFRFLHPNNGDSIVSSFDQILHSGRTGPGASINAWGNDFYTKLFSSPLSCTSDGIYRAYRNYVENCPIWSGAEQARFSEFGPPNIVEGNRLSFVPKNDNVSRVICTEPALNMFSQLGLGRIIERRLKSFFGIDLSVQQVRNRELAQIGSKLDDLVTIDLSSASDSVSHRMLYETFPRDFVAWLSLLRSSTVRLPNGNCEELHMISSMGNGFTFPLETMIFSCIVSASYHAADRRLVRPQAEKLGNFGVFGDDIIVTKEVCYFVIRLLKLLGFTVNADKSYLVGPFRESCGGDYFNGHPVRGVYIKSLATQASRYVAINRLNAWTSITGITLRKTLKRLIKSVRFIPVPLYENDDAGIKVPLSMVKSIKLDKDVQSILYKRWVAIPNLMKITDAGIKPPRGAHRRYYNVDGLLLAGLRGDIKSGSIGIRLGPARYRTKEAISPNWDWLPAVDEKSSADRWRFATAILANIG